MIADRLLPRTIDLGSLARLLPLALICLAIPVIAVVPTPEVSVGIMGGLFVAIATLIRPGFALVLLLALVPFSGIFKISLGDFDLSPTEPLFALFIASWALSSTLSHIVALPRGRYLAPVATLFVLVLASAIVTTKLPLTAKEAIKWLEVLLIGSYVAVHVRERGPMLALLSALFLAAGLEALFGVYQFVTGSGPSFFAIGPFMRAHGHFGQPNPYAGYLASVLPLAVVCAIASPTRRFRLLAA
ncbi:MAG: hypothetical protein ACKVVP_05430, partial [Chloroflexota bacterium]